jgi:hypothetical protein
MKILKEITDWDVEYRQPNHTYLVDNKGKTVAYAKWHSKTDVMVFKSRNTLDKRYRKFIEVKHPALAKIAKEFLKEEKEEEQEVIGDKYTVESESGNVYTIIFNQGRYSCSCVGFGFRGKCKHIELLKEKLMKESV